jgi:hypothetical protein
MKVCKKCGTYMADDYTVDENGCSFCKKDID